MEKQSIKRISLFTSILIATAVLITIIVYFSLISISEKEFQKTKVLVVIEPTGQASLEQDLNTLVTRFRASSGKAEGKIIEDQINLFLTPQDAKNNLEYLNKNSFQAKIGDQIIFTGGEKDIDAVCRNDETCANIEYCSKSIEGYYCTFRFSVYLNEVAAQKQAETTSNLAVNSTPQGRYLSEKLELYIDDTLLSGLLISEELKGKVTTQISISGSGLGKTQEEAYNDAEANMHKLQIILISGELTSNYEVLEE